MHDSERDVDPTIELVPVEPLGTRARSSRSPLLVALVAVAAFLSFAALVVVFVVAVRLGKGPAPDVTVTAQQDAATLRQEAVRAFSEFNAAQPDEDQLADGERQERAAIDALLTEVAACAAADNYVEFRKLVDADRLLKRIELCSSGPRLSRWLRTSTKMELLASIETDHCWHEFQIARVLTPLDDPATRIVYAFAFNRQANQWAEYRLWIARDDDRWKFYDWERLDLGLSKSREWGAYLRYRGSTLMDGFNDWGELIGEVDELIRQHEFAIAKDTLRRAEARLVPADLEGLQKTYTASRWQTLGENAELERCLLSVRQPEQTPGIYLGLMNCTSESDPARALAYAQLYEEAVGPSLDMLVTKARLLKNLGRHADSAFTWQRILRIKPNDAVALSEFYLALSDGNQQAFITHLDQLDDAVAAVVSIAPIVGYRDYSRLPFLADDLNRRAPNAAGTHYVNGLVQYLDGNYDTAASCFRLAYEAESNDDRRKGYVGNYVDAQLANGQLMEALALVPEPKAAMESLFNGYDEGDASLSEDEYRQVVALYLRQNPAEPSALQRAAQVAAGKKDSAEAIRLYQLALDQLPPSQEENAESENDYLRRVIAAELANTLYQQGRLREAFETVGPRRERFRHLARLAVRRHRWDDARTLLEWHRAAEPDDTEIYVIEAALAKNEKKQDEAIRHLQLGLAAGDADQKLRFRQALSSHHIDAGRWLEHFRSSLDQSKEFDHLSSLFADRRDWDSLQQLVVERRRQTPRDAEVAKREAEAAWFQDDDDRYIAAAEELLEVGGPNLQPYERTHLHDGLITSLLRSGRTDRALVLAESIEQHKNDGLPLAIVYAAQGRDDLAHRTAVEATKRSENTYRLYASEYAARHLLGKKYRELQREFPVPFPYRLTTTLAFFVLPRPLEIDVPVIAGAQESERMSPAVVAIAARTKNNLRAFGVPVGDAMIWLATSDEPFADRWQPEDDSTPLAKLAAGCNHWFVVGTAGWTERDRARAEADARRLAARLVGDTASAVCIPGRDPWSGTEIYPADAELIAAWKDKGHRHAHEGGELIGPKPRDNVVRNREFDRSLRGAARNFPVAATQLRVAVFVRNDPALEPMWLNVTNVRRSYGGLEFDGELENNSALIPPLRSGLIMRVTQHEIQGWQANDDPAVERP